MSKQLKVIVMIPARLESSRLPNKVLADICGLPMIIHVLKRCELAKKVDGVYVATDSLKIKKIVNKFSGKVLMTSSSHQTGSDRIAEAAKSIDADIIINVQGDEALVNPKYIEKAGDCLRRNPDINVGMLVNRFSKKKSTSDIKAVLDNNNNILYLSRSDIPSDSRQKNPPMHKAYHIVPFRRKFLIEFSKWKKTSLESIEFNEYLRILENGYKIKAIQVDSDAISVDTAQDLSYVRKKMLSDDIFQIYKD